MTGMRLTSGLWTFQSDQLQHGTISSNFVSARGTVSRKGVLVVESEVCAVGAPTPGDHGALNLHLPMWTWKMNQAKISNFNSKEL